MSARPLRVYGWQGYSRKGVNGKLMCSREIVAARSRAEAARAAGFDRPGRMFNLGETGNSNEIATATAKPLTVFYRHIDKHQDPWTEAPR